MSAVVLGLGTAILTLAALRPRSGAPRRPVPPPPSSLLLPRRWPQWASAMAASLALLVVLPPAAVVPPVVGLTRRRLRSRREERAHARAVRAGLPEAVDLLLLATGAGMSLPVAHPQVAHHCPPPLGPALISAARATDHGTPRADALVGALGPLGDRALALANVLVDHLRYGVPLAPALERLRLELRLDRRRHAEQEAHRVPVRLLGPLVACVLPAFGLLTVVPLLAASLRSLPT